MSSNEAFLGKVKARFFHDVLADEILAQLVLTALNDTSDTTQLPDFMAEPWRPVDKSGQATLGLRFNTSVTTPQGELSVAFATLQNLEVLTMTTKQGERTLLATSNPNLFFDGSEAFMALEAPIEEKRRAALQFAMLWQQFCQTAEMLDAHVDAMSETFTTELYHTE